jgi:hypothetical protein
MTSETRIFPVVARMFRLIAGKWTGRPLGE